MSKKESLLAFKTIQSSLLTKNGLMNPTSKYLRYALSKLAPFGLLEEKNKNPLRGVIDKRPLSESKLISIFDLKPISTDISDLETYVKAPLTIQFLKSIAYANSMTDKNSNLLGLAADGTSLLGSGLPINFQNQGIYLDGSYAFLMLYAGTPCTLVGFEKVPELIKIVQLQGIRGNNPLEFKRRSRLVAKMGKWPKTLVQLIEDFARNLEVPRVGVQRAIDNKWVQFAAYDYKKAEARYDQTAESLGYSYHPNSGLYLKEVYAVPKQTH